MRKPKEQVDAVAGSCISVMDVFIIKDREMSVSVQHVRRNHLLQSRLARLGGRDPLSLTQDMMDTCGTTMHERGDRRSEMGCTIATGGG